MAEFKTVLAASGLKYGLRCFPRVVNTAFVIRRQISQELHLLSRLTDD